MNHSGHTHFSTYMLITFIAMSNKYYVHIKGRLAKQLEQEKQIFYEVIIL